MIERFQPKSPAKSPCSIFICLARQFPYHVRGPSPSMCACVCVCVNVLFKCLYYRLSPNWKPSQGGGLSARKSCILISCCSCVKERECEWGLLYPVESSESTHAHIMELIQNSIQLKLVFSINLWRQPRSRLHFSMTNVVANILTVIKDIP